MDARSAIIVHGGAGPIQNNSLPRRLEGCKAAASAGWKILQQGGSSLDAVEAAVTALEDNPLFNAGTGSVLNSLGEVEMDAAIMDGRSLKAGAVGAVPRIRNPIALARRVLEDGRHVMLAGEGALQFALGLGMAERDPTGPSAMNETERLEKHGTVGCVARDSSGGLAAATSTGGIRGKLPGRVGDSPLIGCGTYANEHGAVSCTGHGETIIRTVLGKVAVDMLRDGLDPSTAAQKSMMYLAEKTGGSGGLILLGRDGAIGYASNTSHMPVCWIAGGELEMAA